LFKLHAKLSTDKIGSYRFGNREIIFGFILIIFKMVLDLAGLPEIRFHILRQTDASIMIKNGIDTIALGHFRPLTALISMPILG
jgi:hypothetical protein